MSLKDLTEFLLKRLADHPERASVTESRVGAVVRLSLSVAEEDKGKVIGKQGKVIKAVRALVGAAAQKAGERSLVDID